MCLDRSLVRATTAPGVMRWGITVVVLRVGHSSGARQSPRHVAPKRGIDRRSRLGSRSSSASLPAVPRRVPRLRPGPMGPAPVRPRAIRIREPRAEPHPLRGRRPEARRATPAWARRAMGRVQTMATRQRTGPVHAACPGIRPHRRAPTSRRHREAATERASGILLRSPVSGRWRPLGTCFVCSTACTTRHRE